MYKAIEKNKRNTVLIMALFVFLIGIVGAILGYVYDNINMVIIVPIVATIYAIIQYYAANSVALSVADAREVKKSDNPRLYRIVENLSIANGQPMPKVYLIHDIAPNAFATGRDPEHALVASTTGLMDIMNDSELSAVMAHEMGHVKNYDIRVSMITFGLVSAIGFITDISLRTMFRGRSRNDNSSSIGLILGMVTLVLAPIFAVIVQMAVSREREFLADASSAMTTRNPEAMASALEKLKTYGRPMQRQNSAMAHLYINDPLEPGLISKLFSTHPPLDERIARLRTIGDKF